MLIGFKDCTLVDAMNGLEALKVLSREGGFDLILLDINMPVMNGIQFMGKLKETGSPEHSRDRHQYRGKRGGHREGIKAQGVGYIEKPFKSENLYELIGNVMEKRNSTLMAENTARQLT